MNQIPLSAVVAKAAEKAKGRTYGGKVAVSTAEIRAAALAMGGYIDGNCKAFGKAMRELGWERAPNGHDTARYHFVGIGNQ